MRMDRPFRRGRSEKPTRITLAKRPRSASFTRFRAYFARAFVRSFGHKFPAINNLVLRACSLRMRFAAAPPSPDVSALSSVMRPYAGSVRNGSMARVVADMPIGGAKQRGLNRVSLPRDRCVREALSRSARPSLIQAVQAHQAILHDARWLASRRRPIIPWSLCVVSEALPNLFSMPCRLRLGRSPTIERRRHVDLHRHDPFLHPWRRTQQPALRNDRRRIIRSQIHVRQWRNIGLDRRCERPFGLARGAGSITTRSIQRIAEIAEASGPSRSRTVSACSACVRTRRFRQLIVTMPIA